MNKRMRKGIRLVITFFKSFVENREEELRGRGWPTPWGVFWLGDRD